MALNLHRRFSIRFSATLLASVLVFALILPSLAKPRIAQAFPGEALAAQIWKDAKERFAKAIESARKGAADLAFKNALKVYLTKFAEDTAVWLAAAGTGQKPLFITDPHYFKNLTDAAAGDFLDTLATNTFGVDVCAPTDLRTRFSIESAVNALVNPANFCQNQCQKNYNQAVSTDTFVVGESVIKSVFSLSDIRYGMKLTLSQAEANLKALQAIKAPRSPSGGTIMAGPKEMCGTVALNLFTCIEAYVTDITTYKQTASQDLRLCMNLCSAKKRVARCTFTEIQKNIKGTGSQIKNAEFIPKITRYFEPGENDIGQLLTAAEKAEEAKQRAKEEDAATRGNSDTQPVKDKITGEVKTPASLTQAAAVNGLAQDPSGKAYQVYTGSPIADAIGVFTNTLTKRLLKRIFEQGFNPKASPGGSFAAGGSPGSGLSGAQAARALFSSIAQPDFTPGGSSVSLADLTSCPSADPGQNNCVIDEGFRQAIEQQMTVQEAIDAKLLNPNVPVGFGFVEKGATTGSNVEPNYRSGYPLRSLLILRRLRIIPVGWEIAAQYFRDFGAAGAYKNQRSLGAIVAGYDKCGQDGTPALPFCGLIDPNWVLKAPELLCKISGSSASLTSNEFTPNPLFPEAPQIQQIGRAEQCADEQSCLQEDENGNCLAFGYCVQERPSWKFGGSSCTNVYHSCETFTDPKNIEASYLTNSLDYQGCTAANAGCRWYCSEYDAATGQFACTATTGQKDYLTSKAKSCPQGAAGCTQYLRTSNNSNLIANGGFEILPSGAVADSGASVSFQGWSSTGVLTYAVSDANSGATAAEAGGTSGQELQSVFDGKTPLGGQSMILSFYGKTGSACSGFFGMGTSAGGAPYFKKDPVTFSSGWQRFASSITFDPSLAYDTTSVTAFFELSGCTAKLDDVQLEFGTIPSKYKEYGSINTVYLNGNRATCRPEEVGCDLYSSATDKIPGVATAADYCPKEAVGCRAFLEVPVTTNGADPDNAVRTGKRCTADQSLSCASNADCPGASACLPSLSLIPKTAKTCSAAYVGCEEYTNLDEVDRGGEGKEYYTYIRECVKPNGDPSNEKTYYTWIGSDVTGFQLKSYLLKPTNTLIGDDAVTGGPAYVPRTDTSLCSEAIFNAGDTPDCRKFYDADLNIYYRLYAKTITVSQDCHPLRNTADNIIYNAIPVEGTRCPASANQCREYRGSSGFNTRTLLSDNFDDGDSQGWDGGTWSTRSLAFGGGSVLAGGTFQTNGTYSIAEEIQQGRSYIVSFWAGAGDAASDNATITARFSESPPSESFEGSAKLRWDAAVAGPQWNFYTLGPLHLDRAPARDDPATPAVEASDQLQFAITGGSSFSFDNIKLFEVVDNLYLIKGSYSLCQGNENCDLYKNRSNESLYLKSFTRLCSQEVLGCEALINTKNSDSPFSTQYANGTNRDGSEPKTVSEDNVDLVVNDPSKYCKEEEQGCTRYGAPTFGSSGFFCTGAPTKACTNDTDCTGVGTCAFQDISVKQYDTVFFADDPDLYADAICRSSEVGCDAWKSSITGETQYFRHPDPLTCDYRTVTIGSQSFTGWYKSGTSGLNAGDACPTVSPAPTAGDGYLPVTPYTQPIGRCVGNPAVDCSLDSDCASYGGTCVKWVGVCPREQSGCTEYRDATDPLNCRAECLLTVDQPTGTPVPVDSSCAIDKLSAQSGCRGYWYLKQTVEDKASECNGAVNDDIGCRKFFSPDPS